MKKRGGWKLADIACPFDEASIALPGEEWRPVAEWERVYRVSNLGRVYSLHQTGRLITGLICRGDYSVIKLRDHERRAYKMTHVMVLETFVSSRPDGHVACHCNGNPRDSRLANLRWDTTAGNQADRVAHGTANYRGPHILTEADVREIRTAPQVSDVEWARRHGMSEVAILQARTGKTWADLDVPPLLRRRA